MLNKMDRKDVKELFDYMVDYELEDFWSNCTEKEIFETEKFDEWLDIHKCKCEHNKKHIVRVLFRLDFKYNMFMNEDD